MLEILIFVIAVVVVAILINKAVDLVSPNAGLSGIIHLVVNAKPATIAVTLEAGGTWHEFPLNLSNEHERRRVYSILFEDGTVWDEKNGWRIDQWCVKETWIIHHNGKRVWWRASNSGFKTGGRT